MDMAGIQKAMVGFALFDMWEAAIKKTHKSGTATGSPLVAAACEAFESYLQCVEVQHGATIQGLALYALNAQGNGAKGITAEQLAPFLAMNVMA